MKSINLTRALIFLCAIFSLPAYASQQVNNFHPENGGVFLRGSVGVAYLNRTNEIFGYTDHNTAGAYYGSTSIGYYFKRNSYQDLHYGLGIKGIFIYTPSNKDGIYFVHAPTLEFLISKYITPKISLDGYIATIIFVNNIGGSVGYNFTRKIKGFLSIDYTNALTPLGFVDDDMDAFSSSVGVQYTF